MLGKCFYQPYIPCTGHIDMVKMKHTSHHLMAARPIAVLLKSVDPPLKTTVVDPLKTTVVDPLKTTAVDPLKTTVVNSRPIVRPWEDQQVNTDRRGLGFEPPQRSPPRDERPTKRTMTAAHRSSENYKPEVIDTSWMGFPFVLKGNWWGWNLTQQDDPSTARGLGTDVNCFHWTDDLEEATEHWPGATLSFSIPNLINVLRSEFDGRSWREVQSATRGANPFEMIENMGFSNRAAIKMVELDKIYNFRPLSFADICGAPGGFTEVMLGKTYSDGSSPRGVGISLVAGDCKWSFRKFNRVSADRLCNFKVLDWKAGQQDGFQKSDFRHGDITDERVILGFVRETRKMFPDGVDLVTADGGSDVSDDPNLQEHRERLLKTCEIAAGLSVLAHNGSLVIKFFDMLTMFTASLLEILRPLFLQISIIKPRTSRACNSERYVVCTGLRLITGPQQPAMHREAVVHLMRVAAAVRVEKPQGPYMRYFVDTFGSGTRQLLMRANEKIGWLQSRALLRAVHHHLQDPNALPLENRMRLRDEFLRFMAGNHRGQPIITDVDAPMENRTVKTRMQEDAERRKTQKETLDQKESN
jgi:23S rRNA U2552 (ribose-2'-O)-methylase RlmE/FtsJ